MRILPRSYILTKPRKGTAVFVYEDGKPFKAAVKDLLITEADHILVVRLDTREEKAVLWRFCAHAGV